MTYKDLETAKSKGRDNYFHPFLCFAFRKLSFHVEMRLSSVYAVLLLPAVRPFPSPTFSYKKPINWGPNERLLKLKRDVSAETMTEENAPS